MSCGWRAPESRASPVKLNSGLRHGDVHVQYNSPTFSFAGIEVFGVPDGVGHGIDKGDYVRKYFQRYLPPSWSLPMLLPNLIHPGKPGEALRRERQPSMEMHGSAQRNEGMWTEMRTWSWILSLQDP